MLLGNVLVKCAINLLVWGLGRLWNYSFVLMASFGGKVGNFAVLWIFGGVFLLFCSKFCLNPSNKLPEWRSCQKVVEFNVLRNDSFKKVIQKVIFNAWGYDSFKNSFQNSLKWQGFSVAILLNYHQSSQPTYLPFFIPNNLLIEPFDSPNRFSTAFPIIVHLKWRTLSYPSNFLQFSVHLLSKYSLESN